MTMTIAMIMKEYMAIMPDTLKTKKEVDEYYKDAMKKSIEKTKQDTINKPKKELTSYQKFVKDNSKIIKQQNPDFTGTQVFSTIAVMWKKQKETSVPNEEIEDKKEVIVEDNESVKEEIKEEVKEEVKKEVKAVVKDVKKKK